jgi:hypothetical protein
MRGKEAFKFSEFPVLQRLKRDLPATASDSSPVVIGDYKVTTVNNSGLVFLIDSIEKRHNLTP